ncbi:MAG: hypothetical protein LBP93_08320 [Treponema sp.]|nr:hypothetical protein [Treponema sp.]
MLKSKAIPRASMAPVWISRKGPSWTGGLAKRAAAKARGLPAPGEAPPAIKSLAMEMTETRALA